LLSSDEEITRGRSLSYRPTAGLLLLLLLLMMMMMTTTTTPTSYCFQSHSVVKLLPLLLIVS